jgi:hypothetical protein
MKLLFKRFAAAPLPALVFGLAGLIPFMGLPLLAFEASAGERQMALAALLGYGAVIVSFVGALQWAYAVRDLATGYSAWRRYGLSVLPALLGWLSLQMSVGSGLRLQAGVFVLVLLLERTWLLAAVVLPEWFSALRLLLTLLAASCLYVASFGALS